MPRTSKRRRPKEDVCKLYDDFQRIIEYPSDHSTRGPFLVDFVTRFRRMISTEDMARLFYTIYCGVFEDTYKESLLELVFDGGLFHWDVNEKVKCHGDQIKHSLLTHAIRFNIKQEYILRMLDHPQLDVHQYVCREGKTLLMHAANYDLDKVCERLIELEPTLLHKEYPYLNFTRNTMYYVLMTDSPKVFVLLQKYYTDEEFMKLLCTTPAKIWKSSMTAIHRYMLNRFTPLPRDLVSFILNKLIVE